MKDKIVSMNDSLLALQLEKSRLAELRRNITADLKSKQTPFKLRNRVTLTITVKNLKNLIINPDEADYSNTSYINLDNSEIYSVKPDGAICDSYRPITNINNIISFEDFAAFVQEIDYELN